VLPISHVGALIFTKNNLEVNKIRIPHKFCKFCGEPLKDWGGKKHLMHPEGTMISDVWKHLDLSYNDIVNNFAPDPVIEEFKRMFDKFDVTFGERRPLRKSDVPQNIVTNKFPENYLDKVIQGDSIDVLKTLPSNCVDMIFVDPPYNLGKEYNTYKDERDDYVTWSLKWIKECLRVLKPGGSFFLLNIPKWAHEIASELIGEYYFQRWIVWDEPAEPRGKLIPAHYAILWFSKTPNVKVNPLLKEQDSMDFCLRLKCRRRRKGMVQDKVPVRDLRWDIHRVKHRGKRFYHPCQLPEKLLEFLIKLSTNEGDIVLDPMMGTGTTLVVAKKLNRHYFGIDIDPMYIKITLERLNGNSNSLIRTKTNRRSSKLTKKDVQIKIGELAKELGRLPTIEEVEERLNISRKEILRMFPSWGKALKYAKLVLNLKGNLGEFDVERN
jgi:site-specific DNA-methyltransferase (adenine-specific)